MASPYADPYLPAGQRKHAVEPATEKLPGPQIAEQYWVIMPVAVPMYPAVHGPLQDDEVCPGVAPYRPAGQSVHDVDPATEYLPTEHIEMLVAAAGMSVAYPAGDILHRYWPALE